MTLNMESLDPSPMTTAVTSLAFAPDGTALFLSQNPSGAPVSKISVLLEAWTWLPDGNVLASGGNDGTVRLWKTDQADSVAKPLAGEVKRNFFSRDGRLLAVAGPGGQVTLHELPGLKAVGGAQPAGLPLGFRAGPALLVTLRSRQNRGGCELVEWRMPDFQPLRVIPLPESTESMLPSVLSPDDRLVAVATASGEILVWDLMTGAKPMRLSVASPDGGRVATLAFSSDSRLLVGSFDSIRSSTAVYLWDMGSGQSLAKLRGHGAFVQDVVFSPDGRTLLSGDSSKLIKLWDVAARKEIATLSGHNGGIRALDVSPDGKTLASCSGPSVRLWNLVTRREVARFELPASVTSLAFAPDGTALFLGQDRSREAGPSTIVWHAPSFTETDTHP